MSINFVEEWLEIQPLAKHLRCSPRMIYKLKADGIIKPGVHFYSVGIGVYRGKCVYSVSACRKSLLERTKEVRNRNLIKTSETYSKSHVRKLVGKGIAKTGVRSKYVNGGK